MNKNVMRLLCKKWGLQFYNIQETLQYIVDTYPYKKAQPIEEQLMFI